MQISRPKIHFIIILVISLLFLLSLPAMAGLKEATSFFRANKLTQALEELEKSSHVGPEAAKSDFLKGEIYLAKLQAALARHYFKKSIEDEAFLLTDYANFFIAKSYKIEGNPSQSIAELEAFIIAHPNSVLLPDAFLEIGICQMDQKEYSLAITSLNKVVDQFSSSYLADQAYYLIGECYEKKGAPKQAAKIYHKLNQEKPLSSYVPKAFARLEKMTKEKTVPSYTLAGEKSFNRGMQLFEKRDYSSAENVFKYIVRNSPKSKAADDALMMVGRCEYRRGRISKSIYFFNKAISYKGNAADDAQYYKSFSYARQGNLNKAIASFNYVISNYPNSEWAPEAQYFMGYFYEANGFSNSAINAYRKYLNNYSEHNRVDLVSFKLGKLLYKAKSYQKAYSSFSFGARLFPPGDYTENCMYWMAKSAEKTDQQDKANQIYQDLVNSFEHSYFAHRAKSRLNQQGISIEKKAPYFEEDDVLAEISLPENKIDVTERQEIMDIWGNLGLQGELAALNSSVSKSMHYEKYKVLMEVGLVKYAAKEAAEYIVKSSADQKNEAKAALALSLLAAGEYRTPIRFADKVVSAALINGKGNELSLYFWQLAYPRGYWYEVQYFSNKYNLDPYLVLAIIREESRFAREAKSRAYALGLMQIIPKTGRGIARLLGIRPYYNARLFDPATNIEMGTYYFSKQMQRFSNNPVYALAAYNGGPHRVSKWLKKWKAENGEEVDIDEFVESIPFKETRYYVQKVLKSYYEYKRLYERKG